MCVVKYVEFNVLGPLLTTPLGSRPATKATHMVVNAAVVDDSHRLDLMMLLLSL